MPDTNSKLTVTDITNNSIIVISPISKEVQDVLTVQAGLLIYSTSGLKFWDGVEWI